MNQIEFETKLNQAYNGTVQPLNRYLNKHAVMTFHCTSCGLKFFNKAGYMVGKKHQRHVCNMPYGDSKGMRKSQVSSVSHKPKVRKTKKNEAKFTMERLNELIYEDYTYKQIASEFKINPDIIKDYFIQEGLIES
jgi:uncharacterized Zn finger protein (UPF0148 family)